MSVQALIEFTQIHLANVDAAYGAVEAAEAMREAFELAARSMRGTLMEGERSRAFPHLKIPSLGQELVMDLNQHIHSGDITAQHAASIADILAHCAACNANRAADALRAIFYMIDNAQFVMQEDASTCLPTPP